MTGTKVVRYALVSVVVLGMAGFCLAGKPDPKPKPECTLVGLTYACYVKCAEQALAGKPVPDTILVFQDLGVVLVNGVQKAYVATAHQMGKSCNIDFTITDWGVDPNGNPETLAGKVKGKGLKNLSGKVIATIADLPVEVCNVVGKVKK